MNMKEFSAFMITVFLPFLVGGTIIGAVFGGVGYYITIWFGLFERQMQHDIVFLVVFRYGGVCWDSRSSTVANCIH